jgi:peroxiredoxin Q/BCP
MAVKPGDPAPDFTLPDAAGKPVTLSGYRGQIVVLYFYPKDETPVCTKEACSFRDAYRDFTAAGAVVIGASGDSSADHGAFAGRLKLPFTLVSDEGNRVRAAYGVPKTFGLLAGRTTYVIDREGVVRHLFTAAFSAQKHVDEALAVVKRLAA